MKYRNTIFIGMAILIIIAVITIVGICIERSRPTILQGVVECTSYKASSKIAGRIDTMLVSQGDYVRRGELLYTLSTPELDAKLQQALAVKSAATALDQKALAGVRKQQIEAARNLWQKAQAGAQLAEKSYQRVKELYDKGVIAAQKYDEAQASYLAATATERAAKAEYDLALAGASIEDKEAAAAQVRQAAGAVDEVESYLRDAMVYSPINGQISDIIAEQGELVGSGYPVVALIDTSDMWATFNIKETMLPDIHIGTRCLCFVPALNQDVEMEVYYIDVQADFATWNATRTQGGFDIRTFAVKMRPTMEVDYLRPGMSVLIKWNKPAKR